MVFAHLADECISFFYISLQLLDFVLEGLIRLFLGAELFLQILSFQCQVSDAEMTFRSVIVVLVHSEDV